MGVSRAIAAKVWESLVVPAQAGTSPQSNRDSCLLRNDESGRDKLIRWPWASPGQSPRRSGKVSSFPRRREPRRSRTEIPAFAGMTITYSEIPAGAGRTMLRGNEGLWGMTVLGSVPIQAVCFTVGAVREPPLRQGNRIIVTVILNDTMLSF